jgi:hypothetical protein
MNMCVDTHVRIFRDHLGAGGSVVRRDTKMDTIACTATELNEPLTDATHGLIPFGLKVSMMFPKASLGED